MIAAVRRSLAASRGDTLRIALLALAFAPFLALTAFAHPSNDDWVAAGSLRDLGYAGCNAFWYQAWVGRFAATAAQCITPLAFGSLAGVRAIEALLLVALGGASFLAVSALAPRPTPRATRIAIALFLTVAHLQQLPALSEYAYWLTAALTYEYGEILLLVALAAYAQAERGRHRARWLLVGALAAFAGAGTNEVVMLLLDGAFAVALVERLVRRRSPWAAAAILAAAALGTAIVVLAPGTAKRMAASHGMALWPAVAAALSSGATHALDWLTRGPLVPAAVLVALAAATTARDSESSAPSGLLTGAATIAAYFSAFLPSYYGAGRLEPHTANTIHLLLAAGLLYHAAVLGRWLALRREGGIARPPLALTVGLQLGVAALLFVPASSNVRAAWSDLLSGTAVEYSDQLDRRDAAVRACTSHVCYVSPLTVRPKTLFFFEDAVDLRSDTTFYKNYKAAYAGCYGKTAIILGP